MVEEDVVPCDILLKLPLIKMKVGPENNKSTVFFSCTVGHLNSSFVPAMGHLLVCFQKIGFTSV